jgi:hypothetical protein
MMDVEVGEHRDVDRR